MIDLSGTWTIPFAASIALLLTGAGLACFLRPDQPFTEGEIASSAPQTGAEQASPI